MSRYNPFEVSSFAQTGALLHLKDAYRTQQAQEEHIETLHTFYTLVDRLHKYNSLERTEAAHGVVTRLSARLSKIREGTCLRTHFWGWRIVTLEAKRSGPPTPKSSLSSLDKTKDPAYRQVQNKRVRRLMKNHLSQRVLCHLTIL